MSKDGKLKDTRVRKTFAFIQKYWLAHHDHPSVREIGRGIGVDSSSLIHGYLDVLVAEKKIVWRSNGYGKRRKIALHPAERRKLEMAAQQRSTPSGLRNQGKVVDIPDFGQIAAGEPLHLPEADFTRLTDVARIHVLESYLPRGLNMGDVFSLRVNGRSMRDAMLLDGDIIILQRTSLARVKDGDVVAVWVRATQETTLKRIEKDKRIVRLVPENPNFATLRYNADEIDVQGKLLAVLRLKV